MTKDRASISQSNDEPRPNRPQAHLHGIRYTVSGICGLALFLPEKQFH
jgi:hypothetical protein